MFRTKLNEMMSQNIGNTNSPFVFSCSHSIRNAINESSNDSWNLLKYRTNYPHSNLLLMNIYSNSNAIKFTQHFPLHSKKLWMNEKHQRISVVLLTFHRMHICLYRIKIGVYVSFYVSVSSISGTPMYLRKIANANELSDRYG